MIMDFSVKDFNVRLRTIRLREVIIAYAISTILTLYLLENVFFISNDQMPTIIFDLFMMIFFCFALSGTRGFKKDLDEVFLPTTIIRIVFLCAVNIFFELALMNFIPLTDFFFNGASYYAIGMDSGFGILAYVLDFILAVVIAPISEELLYRGVLFNRLKIRKGVYWGLLISSIIFGIGHYYGEDPFMHVISAMIFGMLMCALYLKTDNIMICMAVHFLSNLFVYFSETGIPDLLFSFQNMIPILFICALFSLIFVPAYILYYAHKFNA